MREKVKKIARSVNKYIAPETVIQNKYHTCVFNWWHDYTRFVKFKKVYCTTNLQNYEILSLVISYLNVYYTQL